MKQYQFTIPINTNPINLSKISRSDPYHLYTENLNINSNGIGPKFIIYQMYTRGSIKNIHQVLEGYELKMKSLRYYCKLFGYAYILEIIHDSYYHQFHQQYRNLNNSQIGYRDNCALKVWGIEAIFSKYNPEWIVLFDLDISIDINNVIKNNISFESIINYGINKYNIKNGDDNIILIAQDGPKLINTGLLFFHNNINQNRYLKPTLLSPQLQLFFDFYKFIWRYTTRAYVTDQDVIMEIILFYVADSLHLFKSKGIKSIYNFSHNCLIIADELHAHDYCWANTMTNVFNLTLNNRNWINGIVLYGMDDTKTRFNVRDHMNKLRYQKGDFAGHHFEHFGVFQYEREYPQQLIQMSPVFT